MNSVAVEAMAEAGIDIADQEPRRWRAEDLEAVDVVVTMGCGDTCPYVPGTRYEDWDLADPAGLGIDDVRPIRDEIERRVRRLLASLDVADRVTRTAPPRPAGRRRGDRQRAARRHRRRLGDPAQRLSPDDTGLQLLENSLATGAGLVALILAFGAISGPHFNPVVSLTDRSPDGYRPRHPRLRHRTGPGRLRRGHRRQRHVRPPAVTCRPTSGAGRGCGSVRSSPPSASSS